MAVPGGRLEALVEVLESSGGQAHETLHPESKMRQRS